MCLGTHSSHCQVGAGSHPHFSGRGRACTWDQGGYEYGWLVGGGLRSQSTVSWWMLRRPEERTPPWHVCSWQYRCLSTGMQSRLSEPDVYTYHSLMHREMQCIAGLEKAVSSCPGPRVWHCSPVDPDMSIMIHCNQGARGKTIGKKLCRQALHVRRSGRRVTQGTMYQNCSRRFVL